MRGGIHGRGNSEHAMVACVVIQNAGPPIMCAREGDAYAIGRPDGVRNFTLDRKGHGRDAMSVDCVDVQPCLIHVPILCDEGQHAAIFGPGQTVEDDRTGFRVPYACWYGPLLQEWLWDCYIVLPIATDNVHEPLLDIDIGQHIARGTPRQRWSDGPVIGHDSAGGGHAHNACPAVAGSAPERAAAQEDKADAGRDGALCSPAWRRRSRDRRTAVVCFLPPLPADETADAEGKQKRRSDKQTQDTQLHGNAPFVRGARKNSDRIAPRRAATTWQRDKQRTIVPPERLSWRCVPIQPSSAIGAGQFPIGCRRK